MDTGRPWRRPLPGGLAWDVLPVGLQIAATFQVEARAFRGRVRQSRPPVLQHREIVGIPWPGPVASAWDRVRQAAVDRAAR